MEVCQGPAARPTRPLPPRSRWKVKGEGEGLSERCEQGCMPAAGNGRQHKDCCGPAFTAAGQRSLH